MALHTLGTLLTTSLNAVTFQPGVLSQADLAAIAQSITEDGAFGAVGGAAADGILCTGSSHSNTTLDTLVLIAGGPLASIQIGSPVFGIGITPGTFVAAKPSATSVLLSQAATATAAGVRIGFVAFPEQRGRFNALGQLILPGGRGLIKLKPGDVVALDNTGWPIALSAATIGYAGSQWSFV